MEQIGIQITADGSIARKEFALVEAALTESTKRMGAAADFAKNALMGLAGGLSVFAVANMVKGAIDSAAALHDLSQRTGESVENLSALKGVAKLANTEFESVAGAMGKLSKNMAGFDDDSKEASRALAAMGLEAKNLQKMLPTEAMQEIAKAMDGFADGPAKSAAAMALFGKEGAKLIPFLSELNSAGDLHAKVTAEQARQADEFGDNLLKLKSSGKGWERELAMGILPALNELSTTMLGVINGAGGLRDEVKKISEDGSLNNWAREVIQDMTYVVDVVDGAVTVFKQFGSSLGVVGKDIATANGILKVGVSGAITDSGRAEIERLISERAQYLEKANEDLEKRLQTPLLGQRIREAFAATALAKEEAMKNYARELGEFMESASAKDAKYIEDGVKKIQIAYGLLKIEKKQMGFRPPNEKNETPDKETDVEKFLAEAAKREAALIAESEAGKKLTEIDKWMLETLVKVRDGKIKTTEAERVLIGARLDAIGITEKQKNAEEEALQFARERAQMAAKDYSDTAKQLESKKQEVEAIGLTKEALNALTLSRIDERIAKEEAKALDAEGIAGREAELSLIRENIAALNELRAATAQGHYRQAEADIEKEIAEARKKGWEETDRFAREIFSSWAEDGSSAAEKIGKTLRSALLSAIYEATLRPVVFQVYTQAVGMLGGSVGGLSPQSAGVGGLGNIAGTGNSIYNAMSGGGMAGGFLSGMASAGSEAALGAAFVGPSASLAGGAVGAGAEVGALFGSAAGPLAAALPWIGLAVAAASIFSKKRGGPKLEGAQGFDLTTGASFDDARLPDGLRGYTGNSADAQIEQVMKPVLAGLGSTLSTFGGKLTNAQARFSMVRDPKGTADSFVGSDLFIGGKKVFGANNNYGRDDADFQRGVETESKRLTLASIAFSEGIDPVVQALLRGSNLATASLSELDALMAKATGADAFTNTIDKLRGGFSDLDTAFSDLLVGPAKEAFALSVQDIGSFVTDAVTSITPDAATLNRISLGFDDAGNEIFATLGESISVSATTALAGSIDAEAIRTSLKKGLAPVFQDLIGNFDITTASAEDTAKLNAKLNQTAVLRDVFDKLGFGIEHVTASAVNGAHNLESFAANSAAYYQAVTSPQKQLEDATASLSKQFGNFGMVLPATSEEFQRMMDSLDKTTPAGMRMTEAMLSLFPAFQQITSAAAQARQALIEQAQANMGTAQLTGQLRGENAVQQAERANSLAANQMQSAFMRLGKGFMSLSDILAMTDGELAAWLDTLDQPTRTLVNTYLQSAITLRSANEQVAASAAQTAAATADTIKNIRAAAMGGIGTPQTGPTWFDAGTLKGIWAETFGQWFDAAGESMSKGGVDYGSSTERMITMMRAELARQDARLGTEGVDQYGHHPAELAMQVLQENIAKLTGDLSKYQGYESQYSGKGQQLLELDKWREGMLANARGNQDAINAVLESYNEQFRKIVEGATEGAATASTAWEDFKRSLADSLADVGLGDMERKIKAINTAYLDNLKKAEEAAKAAGFGAGASRDAQGKVDTLTGKGANLRDALDAKRAALLEAEQQQRALQATGGLGSGELAQRIATLRGEIARLTTDYTANQAALSAAREKLAKLTAGSDEYARTLADIERLQAAQLAQLKADFMAPISEALSTFDMSAYEKQVYEVNKAFEKNMESARALGLTLSDLSQIETLRDKQLKKAAEDNLRSAYEAYKTHLEGIIAAKKTAEDALRSAYQTRAGEYQATIDKVKDAESALRTAYETKVSEFDTAQKKFADFAASIREFRESLAMGEEGVLSAADRYRRAFELMQETVAKAKGGDETAYGKLQGQASNALGLAKDQAATRLDYLRDFARVDAGLQEAENAARGQSSIAEQQLAALKMQYGWLDTKGDQSLETALKTYEEARLAGKIAQDSLDKLKEQISRVIGIEEAAKSIEELIDEYTRAADAADLAQKHLDELQKQVGALINIDNSINAQGAAMAAAVAAAIASLGGLLQPKDPPIDLIRFSNGGGGVGQTPIDPSDPTYYPGGQDNPLPVTAAVETAQLMARLMQPQQDTAPLIAEIKALREEVKAGNSAIAQNTRDTAKVLTLWDGDGQPEVRT